MRQTQAEQDKQQQAGRWTKEQHQRFMYAIMQYGKDWKKVQQYVKTRTGSQIRSHAQKFFNKLQKKNPNSEGVQRSHQQFSQTQFDIERQLNNEFTPSTPLQLVALIKKQAKDEGGKVNLSLLKQKLEETDQTKSQQKSKNIQSDKLASNSYKSMSNFLSAYQEIKEEKLQKYNQDESFLIFITKRYKKYFLKDGDFGNLIDINNIPISNTNEFVSRKRSFTLPECNDFSADEMDDKIEEIKKQINTQIKPERKSSFENSEQMKKKKENVNEKEGNLPSSINRLATIQQQVREEQEFNSFIVLPNIQGDKEVEAAQISSKQKKQ